MNFIHKEREEMSAYLQLLIILCYAIAGIAFGTILSFIVIILFFGSSAMGNITDFVGNPNYVTVLKISQALTTGFLFILPPLWLARTEKIKIKDFYGFKRPKAFIFLLVFLIMLCSMPLMEFVGLANQKMTLPDFLKPIENWMRNAENEAAKMTELLLKTKNGFDFLINMVVIALLPAIGEELMFRGGVQRAFTRMFKNPHVAIWISAFIFSAIHVQFFGFFPRMFLGAAFGYIYLWTGSLWYAMFAHFLNNAYAISLAWYLQKQHIPLSEADNSSYFPWYASIISLILSVLLFYYLKHKTTAHNGEQLG